MKRLLVLFFLLILLFVLNANSRLTLFDVFADDAQGFYITNSIGGGNDNLNINSYSYVASISKFDAESNKYESKNISSQSVLIYNKTEEFITKKLKLKLVKQSDLNGTKELLGYTTKFKNYVIVDGEKVNVQISVNNNKIIVGHPLILQGF